MAAISLPNPNEPFVDKETGKITDVWYRYLFKNVSEVTTIELTASAPLAITTANVIGIVASTLGFAKQAEQEAGASTTAIVTPSVQQYHPSSAKAWGYVTMAGTVATVAAGYNVNSAASTAAGLLAVNLTLPFSSTNYVVIGMAQDVNSVVANKAVTVATSIGHATTTFTLLNQDAGGGDSTPSAWYFTCYGDQ